MAGYVEATTSSGGKTLVLTDESGSKFGVSDLKNAGRHYDALALMAARTRLHSQMGESGGISVSSGPKWRDRIVHGAEVRL